MSLYFSADCLLARRDRGIAPIIEGISQRDPVAIGLMIVVVLPIIGAIVYKLVTSSD